MKNKKEKILLINPNWTGIARQKQFQFKRIWQPLDLLNAAALLEKKGFSVNIIDNNIAHISPKNIGSIASGFDKIFVTSTPFDRWQCPSLDIRFFFETLKYIPKNRLYIMGSHVTERYEAILKSTNARAAILGEPEQIILDIACNDSSLNGSSLNSFNNHFRVVYLNHNKEIIKSNYSSNPLELNEIGYPAFHLVDMNHYRYFLMGKPFTILEGSRGCPFRCSFCYLGMYGTKFRQKSLDKFVDEVNYVTKRFGIKYIYFMDLEFCHNKNFVLSFCENLIRKGIKINWCCQTRVKDLDTEILKLMKKSGCSLIHLGIESGSNKILKQIGKNIKTEDCIKAISLTNKIGIRTLVFMNFGFPYETIKDMRDTIKLSKRLNPTFASFHLIVPFPGTRFAKEAGLDIEKFPPCQYPQYNFFHHDLKMLKSILTKAYLFFYLRPSYLLGLILKGIRG